MHDTKAWMISLILCIIRVGNLAGLRTICTESHEARQAKCEAQTGLSGNIVIIILLNKSGEVPKNSKYKHEKSFAITFLTNDVGSEEGTTIRVY